MKKVLAFQIILSTLMIFSSLYCVDNSVFISRRLNEVDIINARSEEAVLSIFIKSETSLVPGETRRISSLEGFSFENNSNIHKISNTTDDVCTVGIAQKKLFRLSLNERMRISLPFGYYITNFSSGDFSFNGAGETPTFTLREISFARDIKVIRGEGVLDPTKVDANFDQKGLPTFSSLEHQVNWCLDRYKPSKIIVDNPLNADCSLSYTIQHKGRMGAEISGKLVAFNNHFYRTYRSLTEQGSIVFSDEKLREFLPSGGSPSYMSLFQTADIVVPKRGQYKFEIPFGWLRQFRLSGSYNISFENNEVRITMNNLTPDDLVKPSLLQQLYEQEFLDTGKKVFGNKIPYTFDDWSSLGVSTSWFLPHRKFLECFYRENGLSMESVLDKRHLHLLKSQHTLTEAIQRRSISDLKPLIQEIRHNIWISGKAPSKIPRDRLLHYLKQVKENPSFEYNLWLFYAQENPALFDRQSLEVQAYLKTVIDECPEVQDSVNIKFLNEIWPEFRGKDLFARLLNNRRYTACSDIARVNTIFLTGGMYTDFGVEFNMHPSFLCRHFNIFMMRELCLLAGTSFGASKGHLVLDKVLNFLDNIDRVPHQYREIGHNNPLVPWCAYGILTAMFDIYSDPDKDSFFAIPFSKSFIDVNQMHSWNGNATLGQRSSTNAPISDEEWFGKDYDEQKYQLTNLAWDSSHEMSRVIFRNTQNKNEKRLQLSALSTSVYYAFPSILHSPAFPKPRISNRTWLTNLHSPCEPPLDKLQKYINSARTLNLSGGWQHYFWCQDPSLIPNAIEILLSANVGIQIKTLRDVEDVIEGLHIFDALLEDNRYTNANDVLRMRIMKKTGGLYTDLGVEIRRDITPLLDEYEYALLLAGEGYLDHTIIAASPNSDLVSAYLEKIDNLYGMSEEAKRITPTPQQQLKWTGCNYMISYIDCVMKPSTKILFLREGNSHLIRLHRMDSWNQTGKFGNKAISQTALNIFSVRPK